MKKLVFIVLLLIDTTLLVYSQAKEAYLIVDTTGKILDYSLVLKACSKADVVLFGELHNNPIAHWLENELLKDLIKNKNNKVVFGAEMFEADDQLPINEIMQRLVPFSKWEENIRNWPNFHTDYKPLIETCYQNNISVIATNIPRRYAAKVARYGFESLDSLSDEAKRYMAPLPIKYDETLSCYKNMQSMEGMGKMHTNSNLPKAQAIKDATMAHFIIKYLPSGWLFYHVNGAYHSDYYQGITWYLKQLKPDLKIVTISTIECEDINNPPKEQLTNRADFIILVPSSMTKTY